MFSYFEPNFMEKFIWKSVFFFFQIFVKIKMTRNKSRLIGSNFKRFNILKPFNVSISNGNMKYPIPLKLFPTTFADADIWSLKYLHTFLKKGLYHMQGKFEQNRLV